MSQALPALYFNQLAGRKEVLFDWAKFNWIGSPDWSDHVLYIRFDTPYKGIHDVRSAATPSKCTATATGTTGNLTGGMGYGDRNHF